MTKTDQRAAERLLKRAVEVAIADLRTASSTGYRAAYERNLDRFHVAVQAATLFVTDTRPAT